MTDARPTAVPAQVPGANRLTGRDLLPPALAVALAVLALAPSVAWFDSGELAAAALQLGVPHPTGFPLFDLLGHALARLPLGPAGLRVHLLGAIAAVLAVALWRRAAGTRRPDGPAVLQVPVETALLLLPLLLPALALHVRATEVYPLVWLVAAGLLWSSHGLRGARRLAALGLLTGLGAGLHVEALALAGLAFAVALAVQARRDAGVALRGALLGLGLGLLASLTIVYLPLAARRDPALSWGDVRALGPLLDHLTGASIRTAFADRMGAADGWLALGRLLARDGLWLLLPAALGAASLWRQDRARLGTTLAIAGLDAAYSALVNPMGLRDDQAGHLLLLALSVLAGQGLMVAAEVAVARPPVRAGVQAGLVLAIATLLTLGLLERRPDADLRAGARLVDRLWRDVPPGAWLLTASDHASAGCAFAQGAEGVRPDSRCLPVVFARDPRMLGWLARRTGHDGFVLAAEQALAGKPVADRMAPWLQPLLATAPLRWEPGQAEEDAQLAGHRLAGLPWETLSRQRPLPAARDVALGGLVAQSRQLCTDLAGDPDCLAAPTLAAHLATRLGLAGAQVLAADRGLARQLLGRAAQLSPDQPKILNNLAVLAIEDRQPAQALALARRALAADPSYVRAHRTAARAALLAGQADQAVDHAATYLRRQPGPRTRQWLEGLAREAPPEVATRLRSLLQP